MILVALFIGIILIVAAIRNSQGQLFSALSTDVPQFVVWAAAIFALGAIGWIPGLKPISRGLLALVIIVILLRNYQPILTGFQNAISNSEAAGQGSSGAANAGQTGSGVSIATPSTSTSISSTSSSSSTSPSSLISGAAGLADATNAFGSLAGIAGIGF